MVSQKLFHMDRRIIIKYENVWKTFKEEEKMTVTKILKRSTDNSLRMLRKPRRKNFLETTMKITYLLMLGSLHQKKLWFGVLVFNAQKGFCH